MPRELEDGCTIRLTLEGPCGELSIKWPDGGEFTTPAKLYRCSECVGQGCEECSQVGAYVRVNPFSKECLELDSIAQMLAFLGEFRWDLKRRQEATRRIGS